MSYFNSNITGGSGGAAGGLVTKFEKSVMIDSGELASVIINLTEDIRNYKNITNEQIIVELNSVYANFASGSAGSATLEHIYDSETGELTITSSSSRMPFSFTSAVEVIFDIYVVGAVQMPPPPIYEPIESITVKEKAGSSASTNVTYNFVVNVGQMAILATGAGSWSVSNTAAVLDSISGSAGDVGDRTNQGKYCSVKIVKPTEETGAVSCTGSFGYTNWIGGAYILLDID